MTTPQPPRVHEWLAPRIVGVIALAFVLAACSPGLTLDTSVRFEVEVAPTISGAIYLVRVPASRPSGGIVVRTAGRSAFKIPPGHYPARGMCRVWRPERPPGRQDPPGRCSELERRVPAQAYLVYG